MSLLTPTENSDYTFDVKARRPDGTDLNLTGATIQMTARAAVDGSAVFTKATGGSGITITDATAGEFAVTLTGSSDLANRGGTVLAYDIEAEVGGAVYTLVRGAIDIAQEITV